MQDSIEQPALSKETLKTLRQKAEYVLDELITPDGIYASTDEGWSGPYHSWFGRDSAITTDLLTASLKFGGSAVLVDRARQGLLALAKWQGKNNNIQTGEQKGKLPHEIRTEFNEIDRHQHAANTNEKPWYVDPIDATLKNWDSADSTPLWVIAVIRSHEALGVEISASTLTALREALGWILVQTKECGGFVGFIGADLQPGRLFSGLHNQGWKDSYQIYQHQDGSLAQHPIKDILINADAWAALEMGSKFFAGDTHFSTELKNAADFLRRRFNSVETGFLLPDKSYYAQALDGENNQLQQLAVDVPVALWAYSGKQCVIDDEYIDSVIDFTMSDALFNPAAGLRNYARGTHFPVGTRYHGGDNVYWPFVSGLVVCGLLHLDRQKEAKQLAEAFISGVLALGSNIEMFTDTPDGRLVVWHHPELGQMSSREQAWTAAAVYFGTLYLEDSHKS